jgi:hypothetical protein
MTIKPVPTPKWETRLSPISKFLLEVGIIELDPIGQRLDADCIVKKQGIIRSILTSQDICEIALRHMDKTAPEIKYEYRSIDGGHRKRAIYEFFMGKFATGPNTIVIINGQLIDVSGMFYSELPKSVQKIFTDYNLRFVIYDKTMTDEQAGETFRLRNLSTNVNHQEMLNSYEDNLVAKVVRETSRVIRQVNNVPHVLFTSHTNSKGETRSVYFQTKPSRLSHDEFVARLLCMIIKNKGLSTCSFEELEEMYVNYGHPESGIWAKDPVIEKRHRAELNTALNFILEYAEVRKRNSNSAGITNHEAVMLSRYYMHMVGQHGKYMANWKVSSMDKFYENFKVVLDSFIGKNPNGRRLAIAYVGTGKTKSEMMKKHLAVFDVLFKVQNSLKWLLEEFEELGLKNADLGITIKDKNRFLSREEREVMWLKQDRKCWISGLDLKFEDAVAAHIIPHEEGGETTIDNIVIVDKKLNAKMGSMNAHDYKRMYLELNKEVETV